MKKAAEIMRFQRLVGCGRRTRTSDLRVMSCDLDTVLPPLRAFVPFLLGTEIPFVPLCSVGSVCSKSRMGHGLGPKIERYCDFPSEHWTRIRTNNVMERLNREIRRRTRVVGSFPDGNSALMLVYARLRHVAGTQWGQQEVHEHEAFGGRR